MTTAHPDLERGSAPTAATMETVWTSRFGEIEVDSDLVIDMPEGLIGFEPCRRFVVVTPNENSAFRWLQSLDNGSIAFPIVDPWQIKADYAPTVSDGDARLLGLSQETPKLVFAVVTVPKHDPRAMTANLLAPIVVNVESRRARQVIVTDERYGTKHRIVDELRRGREQAA